MKKITVEFELSDQWEAYYPTDEGIINAIIIPRDDVNYKIIDDHD